MTIAEQLAAAERELAACENQQQRRVPRCTGSRGACSEQAAKVRTLRALQAVLEAGHD